MAEAAREAWITGIGIVSCLGEGLDAHWNALQASKPQADTQTLAPYMIHRLAPLDFDKQIPKKGDQRQMEPWQRTGTYAAGLALDSAGVKGNAELLSRMDMIIAAGGGERDIAVDGNIMTGMPKAADPGAYLNERLMSDLRPTLFLAQLSNLMAGNISIVHGVTGSSRTFMGEESAGVDAVRIALARIAAGQSNIALVGGAFNADRPDHLMIKEFGGFNLKGDFAPVWQRGPKGGLVLGSFGAFIVLEERAHADARGAKRMARLSEVLSDRCKRQPGQVTATLERMWQKLSGRLTPSRHAVISGASGAEPATAEERAFYAQHPDVPVRATGTFIGHADEPKFAMNLALAAMAINRGTLFPPCDESGVERPMQGELAQVVVTGVGHAQGEGIALVEAAS
ncbi:MAG TPA: beta-ketoacyl-ACP synthase [Bradyrhizobium sp.]|nr:beta-ketoacyl-ACP synthase [Bradyrhizobium sp.]